jgi:hypothetical protein
LRILYNYYITSSGGPTAIDATPTDAACGADNGAIRINDVTGGAAPYEYALDGGGYGNTTNFQALERVHHTICSKRCQWLRILYNYYHYQRWRTDSNRCNSTDAACGADNGAIRINDVTGGALLMNMRSMVEVMVTPLTSQALARVHILSSKRCQWLRILYNSYNYQQRRTYSNRCNSNRCSLRCQQWFYKN